MISGNLEDSVIDSYCVAGDKVNPPGIRCGKTSSSILHPYDCTYWSNGLLGRSLVVHTSLQVLPAASLPTRMLVRGLLKQVVDGPLPNRSVI